MSFFIPKKIKVGFQNRSDTYNGKLAYIIYYDKSGILKKEKSFNSWIDDSIETVECENEPTSGFVLNKKAGDYKSDWNHRKAYSRIYDPRGFEFEIDIDNLLFILEHCKSEPGKALGGKFVYAYSGSSLILLPINSKEYKDASLFSEMPEKKINKKKLVVGKQYYNKAQHKWFTYLGNYNINMYDGWQPNTYSTYYNGEHLVFHNGERYIIDKKPNFIAEKDGEKNVSEYINDFLNNYPYTHTIESFILEEEDLEIDSYYKRINNTNEFIKIKDNHYEVSNYFYEEILEKRRICILLENGIIKSSDIKILEYQEVFTKNYFGQNISTYDKRLPPVLDIRRTRINKEQKDYKIIATTNKGLKINVGR